jgi:hypothetical protein
MVWQCADRKFSPVIRRESSMRNPHRPAFDTEKPRRRTATDSWPAPPRNDRDQPAAREPDAISRGLSWLGTCILEGFAMYGESICPCFTDLPEDYYTTKDPSHRSAPASLPPQQNPWGAPARASHHRASHHRAPHHRAPHDRAPHDIDIVAWLAAGPSPRARPGLWSRLRRLWPKRRAAAARQSSYDLLALLDDPALRDGRIERHETRPAPQRVDPFF